MHRHIVHSCLIAFSFCVAALAISPGVAHADLRQCMEDCEAYAESLPEDTEMTGPEIMDHCAADIASCSVLDEALRAAMPTFCDSVASRRRSRRGGGSGGDSPTGYCVMPSGTTHDTAGRRCHCEAPTSYAFQVYRPRSGSLGIEGLRSGDLVFVCMNPYALPGAAGSSDERMAAAERAIANASDALTALCAPHDGEALPAACARAREEFLGLGSGEGPVDLETLRSQIAEIAANDERQDRDIAEIRDDLEELRETESADMLGTRTAIEQLAESHSILLRCLRSGDPDFRVSWTGPGPDGHDVTEEIPCTSIFEAADHRAVEEARTEARRIVREEISRLHVDGGHAFVWLQAYGMVGFNPLVYGNVHYGNVWQAPGLELTFGVGLGDGWNFHGGLGVAYGGPNITGATNVAGEARLGIGVFVIPEVMIGFGFIATHRFLPDVFSATSLYGAYADVTIRFMPNSEWTPILTLRFAGGGSPRQAGMGWSVEPDGLFQGLIGIAHF